MSPTNGTHSKGPRRRIWVQHVAVDTRRLQVRVNAARARGDLTEAQEVAADGVRESAERASLAAFRDDPVPGKLANWWRGTLVETAYRNLHSAQTDMLDLYTDAELRAQIPEVVARANATLHRDDPRRVTVQDLEAMPEVRLRPRLRGIVADSYEKLDLEHAQLRSFRNIVLLAALFQILSVAVTLYFVTNHPTWVPFCFDSSETVKSCPSGAGTAAKPLWSDILIVTGMGALGGGLSATLSIRNLKGTSTPYDVPVALAVLKVPMGAMTAILGLVAIKGGFAPGLSNLDNQGQILAYALLFGFAQQALSRLLDRRAQDLLEGLPGGDTVAPVPTMTSAPASTPPTGPSATDSAAEPDGATAADSPVVDVENVPDKDRPVDEPEGATQQDQLDQLRDTGNARKDQTESEEAELLEAEFGQPNADGIYRGPADGGDAGTDAAAGVPAPAAGVSAPAAGPPDAPPGDEEAGNPTAPGEEGTS